MEIITKNWNDFKLLITDYLEYEIITNEEVIISFNITYE